VYGCLAFNPVTTQTEVRVDIPATQPMTPPTGFSVVPGSLNTPRPSPHKFRWNPVAGASSYQLKQEDLTCPQVPDQVIPIAANEPQPYQGVYPELTMCNGQERDPSRFHFSLQACNGSTCSDWTATLTVTVSGVVSRPAGSGTTTYVHTDGLRSPVAETTAAGTVTSRRYEPYGASTSGQPQQGPGYAGHVTDAETGLSYMQQRYYDPMAGRFLSVDPVAASTTSFNRYAYAANNPYKNIDPDGRYESPAWLLSTVPGQGSFDNAMTSIENGNYGQAAMYGGAMVAEQVLSVATLGQGQAASTVGRTAAASEGAAIKAAAGKADEAVELTTGQAKNLQRFESKLPSANTGTKVDKLGDGVSFTSEVPGKVPGSKAVYQKTVDSAGNTTSYMKTTIDPKGDVVHIKDKINNTLLDKK
jgi:RHS repeat-associated protein